MTTVKKGQPVKAGEVVRYPFGHLWLDHMPSHEGGPWWRLVHEAQSETNVICAGPASADMAAQLHAIAEAFAPPPIHSCLVPWPPKELWSNSRADRRSNTAIRQKYIEACWKCAMGDGVRKVPDQKLRCRITFHAPDDRRDEANMPGAMKYAIDAVANALKVNDRRLTMEYRRGKNMVGGGAFFEIFAIEKVST